MLLFELFIFPTPMQIKSPFLTLDLLYKEYIELWLSEPVSRLHAFSPGCCPVDSLFSPLTPQISVALDWEQGLRWGGSLALIGVIPWAG